MVGCDAVGDKRILGAAGTIAIAVNLVLSVTNRLLSFTIFRTAISRKVSALARFVRNDTSSKVTFGLNPVKLFYYLLQKSAWPVNPKQRMDEVIRSFEYYYPGS